MRTLKRISAIVISLAMVLTCAFSSVVFAVEMNDVTADNPYYKAINDLVAKGIINGYANEDGTYSFKSDGNITRAEFCAIVARADAPAGYTFAAGKSSFTDVAAEHWGSPYIEYAVSRKIVNGMGDGTFAPEAPVTYAQAVKMIVCALNYGFAAEATDPWYKTYIDLANRLGITKNAYGSPDAPAIRGLIAQLTYNMNDTAPAVQTGVDENGKPVYGQGDKNNAEEVTGQVVAVFRDVIEGATVANNQIKIKNGSDVYLFDKGSYSMDDLKEMLGYQVDISYSEDNSGTYTIERITKTSRNSVYVVNDVDIEDTSVSSAGMEYYDDNSSKGKTKLTFSNEMKVLVNGTPKTTGWITDIQNVDSGSIKFIDYDNDSAMDVAFITSYKTIYVKNVTPNTGVYDVVNNYGPSTPITFRDNRDYVVKIANNGSDTLASGTLSSIAKTNIVSYVSETEDESEIIVSKKTATGRVTDINEGKNTIKVGGKEYSYSNFYLNNINDPSCVTLDIDDNCTLYLDYTGKIAAATKTEAQINYGYITNVAPKSTGVDNDEYVVKMYTGSFKTLAVATTGFKLNGTVSDGAALEAAIQSAASTVATGRGSDAAFNGSSSSSKAVLVKYELSANGQLKSVSTIAGSDLTFTEGGASSYSGNKFTGGSNSFNIDSNTKVFSVPNVRTDESKYSYNTGSGIFTNYESYYVDAFDVTNGTAKAVVVYGKIVRIKPSSETIFVRKVETELVGGETVKKLKYDTFATLKTVEDDAKTISTKEDTTLNGVEPGDIIKILTENNVITEYLMIFDASAAALDTSSTYTSDNHHYYDTTNSASPDRVVYRLPSATDTNGYWATIGTVVTSPALTGTETVDATTMKISFNGSSEEEYVSIIKDEMIYKYDSTGGTVGNSSSDIYYVNATRDHVPVGTKVLVISTYKTGSVKGVIVLP